MSFTLLAVIALVLVFFGLNVSKFYMNNSFKIESTWMAGILTLAGNIVLLGVTGLGVIFVPFLTPFFIVLSPVISVIMWVMIKESFRKNLLKRFQAYLLGFSVYLILFIFFTYRLYTIKPSYQGEDMFMTGLGYMIGSVVCFFAILIGSLAFLLPYKK